MNVVNAVTPSSDQLKSFFGAAEDGPFVMVNLLKFKEKADYPDGSDADLSGRDAYLRYGAAVGAFVEKVGGRTGYAGPVTGLLLGDVEDLWDMVALAEYPSVAAMQTMVMDPGYAEISKHRTAGLAGQLNIKTKGSLT
ncbi:MAG: DUF1330 domain-containing protein [Sphingomonadaceae bacterium]